MGNSLISSLGFSETNDFRDSKLSPTTGWINTNNADIAGGPLGGNKNFYRLQTSGAYYVPFKFNDITTVLQVSGRTGMVQAYPDTPDVPIFERYFTGGQDSIRGYDERSVGPHDPNTGDAIGGDAILSAVWNTPYPLLKLLKARYFMISVTSGIKSEIMGPAGLSPVPVSVCVSRPLLVLSSWITVFL